MRVERLTIARADDAAATAAQLRSLIPAPESVTAVVTAIMSRVRTGGDAELESCIREFDTAGAPPPPLRVPPAELDTALATLDSEVRAGLEAAMTNVATVAEAGLRDGIAIDFDQGQRILVREIPVARAAIYVPGGRAPYPSTVVMGAVTARVAGVDQVTICSPPGPGGDVHPAILAACALCGVDDVLRMGGAHAIAALTWGTETVTRADVIAGPGNLFVQEAKRLAFGHVGIDGFQGPSDLLIVLDPEPPDALEPDAPEAPDALERLDPLELVALDLLAQAEHGPDTLVIAVSTAPAALDELAALLDRLPTDPADPAASPPGVVALVHAPDLEAALALADAFAPEHLQLVGPGAEALAPRVRNAGCLLVGATSGTAFTDYAAGSNHILPTAGAARHASALSPRDFRRRMAQVEIGPAAPVLARAAAPLARAEGFEFHARSMEARPAREENRVP